MMSAPSGGDALRALLAERATPSFPMVQPRLGRALTMLLPDLGMIAVRVHDEANETNHTFVWELRDDFSVTDMLTAAERIVHAPLN